MINPGFQPLTVTQALRIQMLVLCVIQPQSPEALFFPPSRTHAC
jgi:hypothetical protein